MLGIEMRRTTAVLFLALCASFLPAATAPAAPQKPAARYDQQILQDVNKYIQGKKEFQGVKAAVEDQIVTLDGTVNLYIERENLEKKVKKMKNVDGIRNHVQIQSNVPDEQLRQSLADRLRYDRVGYGIAFNVITLDVKDGVVTLGGTVHDYPSKDSAIGIAETTPGVKDIVDNIEVTPTSMFDDELRMKLYRAIYGAPTLQRYEMDPQKPIRIVVENGHVTLYGVVDSAMDKQIADTQASTVPGVFSVDNRLIALNEVKK
jgi:hyperosmotically inducible periplasmic protein